MGFRGDPDHQMTRELVPGYFIFRLPQLWDYGLCVSGERGLR